jgi:hypothetical protein
MYVFVAKDRASLNDEPRTSEMKVDSKLAVEYSVTWRTQVFYMTKHQSDEYMKEK